MKCLSVMLLALPDLYIDIHLKMLETYIPKKTNVSMMVVSGKHRGEVCNQS